MLKAGARGMTEQMQAGMHLDSVAAYVRCMLSCRQDVYPGAVARGGHTHRQV